MVYTYVEKHFIYDTYLWSSGSNYVLIYVQIQYVVPAIFLTTAGAIYCVIFQEWAGSYVWYNTCYKADAEGKRYC